MSASHGFGALTSRSASILPVLRRGTRRSSAAEGEAASQAPSESSLQESRGSSVSMDSFDASIPISPPKAQRPETPAPWRLRMLLSSTLSSPTSSTGRSTSLFEGFGALLRRADVAALAQAEGWFLLWSQEDLGGLTPESPPAGLEAVLVVLERGHEAASTKAVRALAQAGEFGPPVFVLLLDIGGAAPQDFDAAMALQHELLEAGAEDVLCNTRTVQELRLAVSMALRRRISKLDAMSRLRTRLAKDAEQHAAEKLKEFEASQAAGIFWQSVDRLFKGFPAMDLRLPKDLEAGTRVGPLTLDALLGEGRYAKVYGSANELSGSREAIKAITKSAIVQCKHATAMYREIEMHSRLEHPHVARFLGVMHGPRHVFLRMEEASGSSLYTRMQSVTGSLPLEDTRRFQAQLSNAVAYCHAQGVAHRDLKPENVALDASGLEAKLVDFGCSVRASSLRTDVVGSLPFMAPEVMIASVENPYSAAGVDIWAGGVILVEMLLGVHHLCRRLGWERTSRASSKRHGELVQYFSDGSAVPRLLRRRFGNADSSDLEELLQGMLQVGPSERWSAKRVAESRWLCSS